MASVYVILGPSGAGRRELLPDLVPTALEEEATFQGEVDDVVEGLDRLVPGMAPTIAEEGKAMSATAMIVYSKREPETEHDSALAEIPDCSVFKADADANGVLDLSPLEDMPDPDVLFLVADGKTSPVDQLEALKSWLQSNEHDLARIITVVHCGLLHDHPELAPWFEACAHFSDVLLLNRRESVSNKWISDYREGFQQVHHPCLIEFVKKGKVANPAAILYPEPRRLSQYFDELDDILAISLDEFTEVTTDGDVLGEDEEDGDTPMTIRDLMEEDDDAPVEEPYFTRLSNGQRVRQLPDIAKYI